MRKDWEIKKLGDVGTFIRGGNFSKKDFVEKGFPCIHYGQIHMKFGIETLEHISSVPSEMVKPDRCAKKGDLVIAITSEDDAGSCKCTAWMGDYDAYVGGHTAIYRHTMQPKFVSYYFNSPQFQKAKLEFTHGFKVVEINPKDIAKIAIPVPPLEEQKRIVKILDEKFAQLETIKANAQTNLQNAKDLFQSQLTKAFSNTTWEKKKVSEISENLDSKRIPITKNVRKTGQYPYYGASGIVDYVEDYIFDGKFLLVSEDGANLLARTYPIAFIAEGKFWVNNHAHILSFKDEITMKFVELFFSNLDISPYVTGMAQPKFNQASLNNIEIPLPPRPEQKRIVEELDALSEKVLQLQEIYTKQIADCAELKQSLLQKAFEGEL